MKKYLLLCLLAPLAACEHYDDNRPPVVENARYEITTVNLTADQPLTPIAVLIDDSGVSSFTIGDSASEGLELLAESGDNSGLLAQWTRGVQASGESPLPPGESVSLTLELGGNETEGMQLTIISMLGNTNDGFTGVNQADIAELGLGDTMSFLAAAYDSGTEANSESAATVPGPAANGEGYNADRDDIRDQVTMHGGVVSGADGLSSSDLSELQRWDNPVARFTITRTQ